MNCDGGRALTRCLSSWKVEWIQQQVVKKRTKRDYDLSRAQSTYFNDPKWPSMWYMVSAEEGWLWPCRPVLWCRKTCLLNSVPRVHDDTRTCTSLKLLCCQVSPDLSPNVCHLMFDPFKEASLSASMSVWETR